MTTITKRVPVDRVGQPFANTVDLELREDGVAISSAAAPVALTRAILTLTATAGGAVTVRDSADVGWGEDQPFVWNASTSVLSMRVGALLPAAAGYTAELDVSDGTSWWRWTLEDELRLSGE